jgi:hypothetical protein
LIACISQAIVGVVAKGSSLLSILVAPPLQRAEASAVAQA